MKKMLNASYEAPEISLVGQITEGMLCQSFVGTETQDFTDSGYEYQLS